MINYKKYMKDKRRELGLSQKEFGKLIGMGQRQISAYETGVNVPSIDTIDYIITRLGGKLTIIDRRIEDDLK